MQMTLIGTTEIIIEHGDASTVWNISSYDKKTIPPEIELCRHINEYWARLPGFRQEKIFGIYSKIYACLKRHSDMQPLVQTLLPLVAQLYEEHALEDISRWMSFHSDISVPPNFVEEYKESEKKSGTREKTYLQGDYQQLAVLALCLRTMVPVWGEFINKMFREVGNVFKEYRAFQLLSQTPLMHSAPVEKLRMYVNRNIQMNKINPTAIMKGVGSQDYPSWLLSLVVVRRVCVGGLANATPKSNLVTSVFNYVNNKVTTTNSTPFGEVVKAKEFSSGDSNSDLNVSRQEAYKIKQELSQGDVAMLEFYMEDPVHMARLLKPDVDVALLMVFLEGAMALTSEDISRHSIVLTQWVLKPAFPPRGVTQLSKMAAIRAIAIAQTVLWEKGHRELAALMTAIESNLGDELQQGSTGSRSEITKAQMSELTALYPYGRASKKTTKVPNVAAVAIELVADMIAKGDWLLSLPESLLASVNKTGIRRYSPPSNARILLADLVIQIAKRA